MRVAHIITRMIIGGAQENTLFNCLDLIRLFGDEVLLITGPARGPEGHLLGQGREAELPVVEIPVLRRAIHPAHDTLAYRAIRRTLAGFRPDVVHTHSAKGGMLGRAAAWSLGVPAVVHTIHGAPFHPYQSAAVRAFNRRCERWAAGRCHRLISVADAMTDLMVAGGVAPRERFTTVYSGMDVEPLLAAAGNREAMRQRLGIASGEVVIGKIARLFHLKGHDDLLTAAARIVDRRPDVRFLLVGDGILRQTLARRAAELGIGDRLIFAGLVPPEEIPAYLSAMDLLVHTSFREGLARALPQALIAGRPVISYDVDGAREVVAEGETGFLVPPGDTGALADRMLALSGDAALRQRLGAEGQRRTTEPFRHQTMTRRLRDLYSEIPAEPRPRRGRGGRFRGKAGIVG
jgi:glycosyltransferase involved in cell wall biosynthesis